MLTLITKVYILKAFTFLVFVQAPLLQAPKIATN